MIASDFSFGPVVVWNAQGQPWLYLVAAEYSGGFAKADENERWITLKPHAEGEGGYVHVKVKVQGDGSAHVVSGPGELRGLRLTRLASPEELERRRKERESKAKEKRQQEREEAKAKAQQALEESAQDPHAAQRHAQAKLASQQAEEEKSVKLKELHEKMMGLHEQLLTHAGHLTGDQTYGSDRAKAAFDPTAYAEYKNQLKGEAQEHLMTPEAQAIRQAAEQGDGEAAEKWADLVNHHKSAASVIASQNVRKVSSGLKALRKQIIADLVRDPQLKNAVLGADAEVSALPERSRPSASPGYQRNTAAQALEHGYTEEDAKQESGEVFDERMAALRREGEEEKADAITKMRRDTIARANVVKELTGGREQTIRKERPVDEVSPQDLVKHAENVKSFLAIHTQLEELERQKRQILGSTDPDTTPDEQDALDNDLNPANGAEVDADLGRVSDALNEKLNAEVQDAAKADLTRAFLDETFGEEGRASQLVRQAMTAHIGSGAYGHLSNVALSVTGQEAFDRQIVDALGTDAAAQLTAHALRRDAPDKLNATREGLARHHEAHSLSAMQSALDFAQATRAAAAQIEVPSIKDGTDAALVRDLIREKKHHISAAHERLGAALGEVEASAALNLALKGSARQSLSVRFGEAATKTVALQLRALGLRDEDYALSRDGKNALTATIYRSGMDRLTPQADPMREQQAALVARIKRGEQDDPQYLPAGFLARNSQDETQTPGIPASFQAPADFSGGVQSAVHDTAGRMYADGHTPRQILTHLLDTVSRDVPSGAEQEFSQRVTDLIPFAQTEERTAKDGTPYTAYTARDVDNDPEIRQRLEALSDSFLQQHQTGEAAFHAQRLDDNTATRDALFRAVSEEPALQAAFSPPADLGGTPEGRRRAAAVKNYFLRKIVSARLGGKSPQAFDETQSQKQREALHKLGSMPEKWGGGGDLFGGMMEDAPAALTLSPLATPEQHAAALAGYGLRAGDDYHLHANKAVLTESGKAHLKVPEVAATVDGTPEGEAVIQGGLDGLNPAWVEWQRAHAQIPRKFPTTADMWQSFKDSAGGTTRAYAAVQEAMQGDLMTRFVAYHGAITGQQLRVSKRTGQHWETRLAASDPDKAAEIRARDRAFMDDLRERDHTGRYAQMEGGSLAAAVQAKVEKMNRQSLLQGGLGFDLFGSKGGGEVTGQNVHDLDVGPQEVPTIGRAAEQSLSHILNSTSMGLRPTDAPTFVIPNLDWGKESGHVGKQRAVKMLLGTGRLLGFLGAGSGKTGTQIGGFTQAHEEGLAKKGIFVVPSIVRNQFGEEAARFTVPGRYKWHAQDASYAERKGHYSGDTHMIVTTHATFRDDMLKLMAEHSGVDVGTMMERFNGLDRAGRTQTLAAALEHHGIPLDYLAVDEAHDFLNRAGKQDSGMSKVLEAALDLAKFKSLWTGSPVKNDASEIYDWISKVDPTRFSDREEFLRKFGVNTQANRESLQRLLDGYSYVDAVTPKIDRSITWGKRGADGQAQAISLTPEQQAAYQGVHEAFARASAAQRRGQVDVEACKTLSPRSFVNAHPQDHEAIAGKLQSALGTLKHNALSRVVNEFPAPHNAKVQHVLSLAEERRGKGGVIFARNRASVAMLKAELEAAGHKVGVIDGRSSSDDKAKVRKGFDSGAHDIVICSDAGATGANLQARGEWLVNYDLPQTQKTLEQRNARIDRLGQKRAIELHHLTTDTAYDRDNVKRLDTKRELGSILQGEFQSLEDTGIAAHILRAQAERDGDVTPSWEEPLTALHENAKPKGPQIDVPDDLPAAVQGGRQAASLRA